MTCTSQCTFRSEINTQNCGPVIDLKMGVTFSLSRPCINSGTCEVSENNIVQVLPNIKIQSSEPLSLLVPRRTPSFEDPPVLRSSLCLKNGKPQLLRSPCLQDDKIQSRKPLSLLEPRSPSLEDGKTQDRKPPSPLPRRSPSLDDNCSNSCSDRSTTSDTFVLEAVVKSYHYDKVLKRLVANDRILSASNTSQTQLIMADYGEMTESQYPKKVTFSRSHKDLMSQFIAPTETKRQIEKVVSASSSAPSIDITSRECCVWSDVDVTRFRRKTIAGRRKPDDRPIIKGMAPVSMREREQKHLDDFIELL